MAGAVVKRPGALVDIADIWRYIATDSGEATADALLGEIDEKVFLLAAHPRLGRARPELAPELRSLALPPYVIFYRPLADGIELIRVIHGARDIGELFDSDDDDALVHAERREN